MGRRHAHGGNLLDGGRALALGFLLGGRITRSARGRLLGVLRWLLWGWPSRRNPDGQKLLEEGVAFMLI